MYIFLEDYLFCFYNLTEDLFPPILKYKTNSKIVCMCN